MHLNNPNSKVCSAVLALIAFLMVFTLRAKHPETPYEWAKLQIGHIVQSMNACVVAKLINISLQFISSQIHFHLMSFNR